MAQVAQNVISSIISNDCLKRVGVKPSPDNGLRFDMSTGQFFVYSPRVWCQLCNNRKAEFSYNNQVYCTSCIETMKANGAIKPKVEEKGKKKEKVKA